MFSRFRQKVILKRGSPYLRRWYLLETSRLEVMLHALDQPDADRYLHDHPWRFLSIVLRGGYLETRTRRDGTERLHDVRRINFIGLRTFHRIERVMPGTWTLVITGGKKRGWAYRVPWDDPHITPSVERWDEREFTP